VFKFCEALSLLRCEEGRLDGLSGQGGDYEDLLGLRPVPRQQLEAVPRRHCHAHRRPRATASATAAASVEAAWDDGVNSGGGGESAEEGDEPRNVRGVRQDQPSRATAAAGVAAHGSAVASAATADSAGA
jgi:hypothetical protein